MKRLIIHIGSEKTATTFIQNFLNNNRENLLTQGIYYPNIGFNSSAHFSLIAALHEIDNGRPLEFAPNQSVGYYTIESEWVPLVNEINRREDIHTVILSAEHFSSRLKLEGIRALKNILSNMNVTVEVICYFRRQDDLMASAYSTHIKGGGSQKFEVYYENRKDWKWFFDFNFVIDSWESMLSPKKMIVRPYDLVKKNIIRDFFSSIDIIYDHEVYVESFISEERNEAWGAEMLSFVRLINELEIFQGHGQRFSRLEKINEILFSGKTQNSGSIISNKCRKNLLDQYKDSNNKLCEKFNFNYNEILHTKNNLLYRDPDNINFEPLRLLNMIMRLS